MTRWRWFGLGLLLVVAALYVPFLGVPWEYDDKVEILQNRVLRSPGDFAAMWEYNPFRVLLMYTFAWDIWAWGLGGRPLFRAENVLIHGANALLLLGVVRGLLPRLAPDWGAERRALLAAGTAAVFAVHPLAIESVTYVSGRSSSLATTFVLASTLLWLGYLDRIEATPDARSWLAARLRRLNIGLGAALLAAGVVGLPTAWLVAHERLAPGRGLTVGLGGTAVLLLLLAVSGADRWRALQPPEADEATRSAARGAGGRLVGAFLLFVLGVLTKEIAATLPAVLFLVEWIAVARGDLRAAASSLRGRLFPFVAIPAFLLALRIAFVGYVASPVFIRSRVTNVLTQIEVLVGYLRLWVLPFPQSIHHDHPPVPAPGTPFTWLCAAALVLLLVVAIRARERAPAFALGVLVAAVTIAPTSSIFPLKETMVEHRTYLPSVGLALATAWVFAGPVWSLAARMGRKRPILHAAAPLLLWLGALGVEHVAYQSLWRAEETLWSNAVAVNPRAADAWRYLGDLYAAQSRWGDAEQAYEGALALRPADPVVLGKLGHMRAVARDFAAAEALFERARTAAPCYTPPLNNLARMRLLDGDVHGAVELYSESTRCRPDDNYIAERALGDIYYGELKDAERAAQHYERALQALDPRAPEARLLKERLLELTW